jgi:16S rRNA (uracil1498-N3)-methyltransferase
MTIRLHVDRTLVEHDEFALPDAVARHAQVRRVQPGDALRLFDGRGHEHAAQVLEMGRRAVRVRVGTAFEVVPELPQRVTLALGMPANERMDTLVEKATELGVQAIQPLECERSVLRLTGERAQRKREHWQAVAVAASEQCGRAWVPQVAPVCGLAPWLQGLVGRDEAGAGGGRWLLSFSAEAQAPGVLLEQMPSSPPALCVLSGPEGGLSSAEEAAARAAGFAPVTLGPRVLRADTAPLAVLAWLSLQPGA